MNIEDFTAHMRGATKQLADLYAEMNEIRLRPSSRKWNASQKQAALEKVQQKIEDNRTYSKHLSAALTRRTPTHDSVVALSTVDSRIKSVRRALKTAELLKQPWTKQRRELNSELDRLLEQRKTTRAEWAGIVYVSLKLKVTVSQNGYVKDLTINTKTVECRNNKAAKNAAIRSILDGVMEDIEYYEDVVDSRNVIGALHRAYTNPNDRHEMQIHYNDNTSEWTPGNTLFSSVEPFYEIPSIGHNANSNDAPTIPGLTSHPDEIFGCVVGALHHYLSTNNHYDSDKATIFSRLFGFELTEPDKEALEHVQGHNKRMGASREEILDYLNNYFPKTVRWYLHVGVLAAIKSPKPKTTNYDSVHFTLDNHHFYIGKRKKNIDINNLPTEIIEGEIQDYPTFIDGFKHDQLLIRMPMTMNEFCVQVREKTGIIPAVQVDSTGVTRVLINNCVYIENDEFEAREKVWNKMQEKYKHTLAFRAKFSDQTATQITRQLMDVFGLKTDMFESFDNIQAAEIYHENLTGPFQGPIDHENIILDNLNLVDFVKNYFQLTIMMRDEWLPVFHARDSWEGTDTEIKQNLAANSILNAGIVGDVLIKPFKVSGAYLNQKVYPTCIVKLLLKRGWISHTNILSFRGSSRKMPVRVIYDFLVRCYNELGGYEKEKDKSAAFKMCYTRMFGYFGINFEKHCVGQLTTSRTVRDEALQQGWDAKYLKYDPEFHDNIYLVYKESAKPKLENFNPIFRFAATGSTVMLLDMLVKMRKKMPNVQVLSGRVDGLYFQNVTEAELADFKAHLAKKTFSIPRDDAPDDVLQCAVVEDKANPKNVITQFGKSKRSNPFALKTRMGSLVEGFPGVGKSYKMAQDAREDVIDSLEPVKILFTAIGHKVKHSMQRVADDIKREFPLNVEVTVSVLATYTEMLRKRVLRQKFDFIYVDEFGQLKDEDLKTLYCLHNNYDRCVQRWYGDQNQLKSIKGITLNTKSSALKWLLPDQSILEYKFDGTTKHRLNEEMFNETMQFWNTGYLTPKLLERFKKTFEETGQDVCANNMTVTNEVCRQVDKLMTDRGLVLEKQWYVVTNGTFKGPAAWSPLNKIREKRQFHNGDLISEEERADFGLSIEDKVDAKTGRKFPRDVRPASCLTSHRIQGSTVNGDWTIWDPLHSKNTRESMFVMLTRGGSLNKLHGVCSNLDALKMRQFKKAADYAPGCLHYEQYLEEPEPKYQSQGWIIYRIEDESLKVSYVGITHCSQNEEKCIKKSELRRLKEHLNEKVPQGILTEDATIETLHWFRAVHHDPKYADTERFFVEWDVENSPYTNINKDKVDRAIKKTPKPVEVVETPEPELSDLEKLNRMLTTYGFSPMNPRDDKFLQWSQRFGKGSRDVKNISRKLNHDRVEWVLYEAIKGWITGDGQKHAKICSKSLGAKWL